MIFSTVCRNVLSVAALCWRARDTREVPCRTWARYGVYLAENSTKADEYAERIPTGPDEGLATVLVVRPATGPARPFASIFGQQIRNLV